AQKIWIDLVLRVPLAGVPYRPDRPQPELLHQPPDPPAANRNPLTQQRHLEPAAAVDRMVGENPVEPLQKLEFLRRFRPRPVIEAASRNPQQRALPDYGQPRFRRNHRHARLEFGAVLLPLYAHVSRSFGPVSLLAYPAVQKSGAAASTAPNTAPASPPKEVEIVINLFRSGPIR